MRILPALLAALLCAAPVHARTLDMPDDATASLLRAYLANSPPDFETMAANSNAVRRASEFDRAAALAAEAARLRRDYMAMGKVDGIALRLANTLGEPGEKYGPHTDAFDVVVSGKDEHRARQYLWGAPFPLDDDRSRAVSFARQENNWQVETVVFEPEVNRTVLLLQLIGARDGGGDAMFGASDVRL